MRTGAAPHISITECFREHELCAIVVVPFQDIVGDAPIAGNLPCDDGSPMGDSRDAEVDGRIVGGQFSQHRSRSRSRILLLSGRGCSAEEQR